MYKNRAERERKARVQPSLGSDPQNPESGAGSTLAKRRWALRQDYFKRTAAWNARVNAAKAQRRLDGF